MSQIKKLINGKHITVSVTDKKCRYYECLVISDCNNPGHFYCRINEIQGCPAVKIKKKK